MTWVATAIVGASLIVAGASVWSQQASAASQRRHQAKLMEEAEAKEREAKSQMDAAKAKSEEDARKRALRQQRSASDTMLTGATGVEEEEDNLQKKTLLGG